MNVSARQHMYENGRQVRSVVRKVWHPSVSNAMAFVDEYKLMDYYGFGEKGHHLLNKIQSPGYKIALAMHLVMK